MSTIDFAKLLGGSTRYNLHSHTEYCDGRDAMEDFVIAAIRQGFTHYGFSPHSPTPFPTTCNMRLEDVEPYLAEVERLRLKYPSIQLFASMEIDYLGKDWGPHSEYFAQLPLDYRIGSVHFIPNQDGKMVDVDGSAENFAVKMEQEFGRDIRYVVEKFYERSLEMVHAGGFDIIGHLDKIGSNASSYCPGIEGEAWYETLATELIDAVASRGITVEINTKAYNDSGRMFPSERLLKRVQSKDIAIVVNSDAHFAELIDAGREEGLRRINR